MDGILDIPLGGGVRDPGNSGISGGQKILPFVGGV